MIKSPFNENKWGEHSDEDVEDPYKERLGIYAKCPFLFLGRKLF